MYIIITNAFSINMMVGGDATLKFERVPLDAIKLALSRWEGEIQSAVGHADVAALFSAQLGIGVPMNRVTVQLGRDTTLLVGQYKGPRLPEGTTELPEGATIEWWLVEEVKP